MEVENTLLLVLHQPNESGMNRVKACSHETFLRIRLLLAPKIGSCEQIENDLPTHGSVILKKRMEIEHALSKHFSVSKNVRHNCLPIHFE